MHQWVHLIKKTNKQTKQKQDDIRSLSREIYYTNQDTRHIYKEAIGNGQMQEKSIAQTNKRNTNNKQTKQEQHILL